MLEIFLKIGSENIMTFQNHGNRLTFEIKQSLNSDSLLYWQHIKQKGESKLKKIVINFTFCIRKLEKSLVAFSFCFIAYFQRRISYFLKLPDRIREFFISIFSYLTDIWQVFLDEKRMGRITRFSNRFQKEEFPTSLYTECPKKFEIRFIFLLLETSRKCKLQNSLK